MRSYFITAYIVLVCAFHLNGQSTKFLEHEARLVVENDAFTLNLYKDQYYSSGIYPAFRYVHDTSSQRKIIHGFQLNHRIYTPKKISWRFEELFDRPYAGQFSASFSSEYYFKSRKYFKWQLELGWMGPSTRVDKMHEYWHQIFHLGTPKGWKYQINDSPLATIYLNYGHSLIKAEKLEILSESNLAAGTTNNWVRQEFTIRFGRFLPINQSSYYSAQLGNTKKLLSIPVMSEFYAFYAPGYEYVFYNATIEGNLIGDESPFVKTAKKQIFQHRYGIMMSWPSFDLGFIGYIRSPETTESTGHYYVGIRMNQRF